MTVDVPSTGAAVASVVGPSQPPHRTPHLPRLPRQTLDPVAGLPRPAAHQEPVPTAQLVDGLPDVHVIGLDAVGGELFTCPGGRGLPIGTAAEQIQGDALASTMNAFEEAVLASVTSHVSGARSEGTFAGERSGRSQSSITGRMR